MKKFIVTLSIGAAILFGGCTLKGTPNEWAGMLADDMKNKGEERATVRLPTGMNAEIVIYDAVNHQNRIHYISRTNAFNTFKAEYEEDGGAKSWHKSLCNQYPISEAIEKGLEVVYTIHDKNNRNNEIKIATNRFDCAKL
jgi:hypothetical protein